MDLIRYRTFGIGVLVGLVIGSLIYSGSALAARQYVKSREYLTDFSDSSIPVLNQILRDLWWSVDNLDDRVAALE